MKYTRPLYIAFIDYEKAFDSPEISAVMQGLRNQGVEESYVRILEDIYSCSTAGIVLHKPSNKISIKKEVTQGAKNSPLPFSNGVFRVLDWEHLGIRVNGECLGNLRFADDIALLITSRGELQSMITELDK